MDFIHTSIEYSQLGILSVYETIVHWVPQFNMHNKSVLARVEYVYCMPCPSMGPKSKMISDCPNCFGRVQTVLVWWKLFLSDPNHIDKVQIRLLWNNYYNLDLSKMIWTRPKQIEPMIGTRPKWFGRSKIIFDP